MDKLNKLALCAFGFKNPGLWIFGSKCQTQNLHAGHLPNGWNHTASNSALWSTDLLFASMEFMVSDTVIIYFHLYQTQ